MVLSLAWQSSRYSIQHVGELSLPTFSPTVLFASCDLDFRQTQERMFLQAGYQTYGVSSAAAAQDILRAFTFRLVILDHTLSREERLALVQLTRQLSPRTLVVVLHASGQDTGADLVLDSRLGSDRILQQVRHLLTSEQV
jgi:DNA-binding response OmpR family regulator